MKGTGIKGMHWRNNGGEKAVTWAWRTGRSRPKWCGRPAVSCKSPEVWRASLDHLRFRGEGWGPFGRMVTSSLSLSCPHSSRLADQDCGEVWAENWPHRNFSHSPPHDPSHHLRRNKPLQRGRFQPPAKHRDGEGCSEVDSHPGAATHLPDQEGDPTHVGGRWSGPQGGSAGTLWAPTLWSISLASGGVSEDTENTIWKRCLHPEFTAALFTVAKTWKLPMSVNGEWIKRMRHMHAHHTHTHAHTGSNVGAKDVN